MGLGRRRRCPGQLAQRNDMLGTASRSTQPMLQTSDNSDYQGNRGSMTSAPPHELGSGDSCPRPQGPSEGVSLVRSLSGTAAARAWVRGCGGA